MLTSFNSSYFFFGTSCKRQQNVKPFVFPLYHQRKTMLKFLGIAGLLLLLAGCRKATPAETGEQAVNKKVEFHVHTSTNYSAPAYQYITADIKMTVYKINNETGQSQLLWDTTIKDTRLSHLPHLPQKYVIEKSYPILESKEKLQANYNITYNTSEGVTPQNTTVELLSGDNFAFLDVDV